MDEVVEQAITTLKRMLQGNDGHALEAAREVLKYDLALRLQAAQDRAMTDREVDSHLKAVGLG